MKQLLTILHAENRLSPSVLSLVKGGDGPTIDICNVNKLSCEINSATCIINQCKINDQDCNFNYCNLNCLSYCISHVNPRPDCPTAIQF